MVEKKATKAAAPAKKTATQKKEVKKSLVLTGENVGFKAGDVYQALATAGKALSVAEVAKLAKISEEETLVGMGWLFKEGKIKEEGSKIVLA